MGRSGLFFADFLPALNQPEPQRLLFVFAGVELPDEATPAQRERFEAGQWRALVPLMCVDKLPCELASFSTLAAEAAQFGKPWDIVFAAAISGSLQSMPSSADAEKPLQRMVEAVKRGEYSGYVPFDVESHTVQID